MEKFSTFFERVNRNPLRKQKLRDEGIPNNKDWVEQEVQKLEPDEKTDIRNLRRRKNTSSNDVDTYKKEIETQKRNKLTPEYLRGRFYDDLRFIKKHRGVKIYVDQYIKDKYAPAKMITTINNLLNDYGDITPRRGFEVIISNADNNPKFVTMKNIGRNDEKGAAYYHDRRIFIDDEYVKNVKVLLHEYAHFLAERIPSNTRDLIKKEYKKMLNSYFKEELGKNTRRNNLEGIINDGHREKMAMKMGLPPDLSYASTNFDEWFAVLVENWKNLPNNRHTYQLKGVLKKILIRI